MSTSKRARRTIRVTFARRRRFNTPHATSERLGMCYVAGDERFAPYRMTRTGLVLVNVRRLTSAIVEESTGPCDPLRWR